MFTDRIIFVHIHDTSDVYISLQPAYAGEMCFAIPTRVISQPLYEPVGQFPPINVGRPFYWVKPFI